MESTNIRYTVTAIKKDGMRSLAFDNNSRNTYATEAEAITKMNNVIQNNSKERVEECVGKDLQVRPVDCWSSGDAKGIYFDN